MPERKSKPVRKQNKEREQDKERKQPAGPAVPRKSDNLQAERPPESAEDFEHILRRLMIARAGRS